MNINIKSRFSIIATVFVLCMALIGTFSTIKFSISVLSQKEKLDIFYYSTIGDPALRERIAEKINNYVAINKPLGKMEKEDINYNNTFCYPRSEVFKDDIFKNVCEIQEESIRVDSTKRVTKIIIPMMYRGAPIQVEVDPQIKNYEELLALKIMIAIGLCDKKTIEENYGYREITKYLD